VSKASKPTDSNNGIDVWKLCLFNDSGVWDEVVPLESTYAALTLRICDKAVHNPG